MKGYCSLQVLLLLTLGNIHRKENDETESRWNNFEMAPKWHGEKETHKRVEVSHIYSISLP